MSEFDVFDPEVRSKLDEINEKFKSFIVQQKNEIIKSREEYFTVISNLKIEHQSLTNKLKDLISKENELNSQIKRENNETQEVESRINQLKIRLIQLQQERETLSNQVKDLNDKVQIRRNELTILQNEQRKQIDQNIPEVLMFERLLGLKFSSLKTGCLKFIFINIDDKDPQREYELNLDVNEYDYKVLSTNPNLNQDLLNQSINNLNNDRDLVKFLKQIREFFQKN
ncbi:hypothetical protein WICMUC_000421 [Wickerhamomyces mucosus]|uniref:Kinetochore protein SPC25 n=1 Tax=Wickerhamomyces mucosus TaxID=1378264 RepID=A0A9P8TIU6_9ASCO|nr:hypothetical protein WICMUC_000421 [Wickerhamomyces mucosus]